MPKTTSDVLQEWVLRGYITTEQSENGKYQSYIEQAKDAILAYCNIPLKASMPEGLFYPWVEIAWSTAQGMTSMQGTGEIKSISEGDTTIHYDVGTSVLQHNPILDYTAVLDRYRRIGF